MVRVAETTPCTEIGRAIFGREGTQAQYWVVAHHGQATQHVVVAIEDPYDGGPGPHITGFGLRLAVLAKRICDAFGGTGEVLERTLKHLIGEYLGQETLLDGSDSQAVGHAVLQSSIALGENEHQTAVVTELQGLAGGVLHAAGSLTAI